MLTPLGKSLSGNWGLLGSDQPVVCELTVSPHSTQVLHPACGPFSAMEKVTMETEEQTSYLYRTYSFLTFFLPPSFLPFLFSPSFFSYFLYKVRLLLVVVVELFFNLFSSFPSVVPTCLSTKYFVVSGTYALTLQCDQTRRWVPLYPPSFPG